MVVACEALLCSSDWSGQEISCDVLHACRACQKPRARARL